ncbi:nucleotidyltransferase domain-containing protein [Limnobacter sp.]|uniref:nucleotidyltransferase domain-containing protein n=1 Tax=Limnobacter sp. TaxID=2003368 RepID=UPI00311F52AB
MIPISISDSLFSKTQQKVLALLFLHPERSFYLNEVVRHANAGKGAVQRELLKLESSGLVLSTPQGNQKHFQANRQNPVFSDLRSLIIKTFGIREVIANCLQNHATKINRAFIFGSIAKGTDNSKSDIDLMVVSDQLHFHDLFDILQPAEQLLGRTIQPTLYRTQEFAEKKDTEFMRRIFDAPTISVVDVINEQRNS